MSSMEKSWIFQLKSLRLTLEGTAMFCDGNLLSTGDTCRVVDAYVQVACLLLDIGTVTDHSRTLSFANVTRWLRQLTTRDVAVVADTFKGTLGALRSVISKDHPSRRKFRHLLREMSVDITLLGPAIEIVYAVFQGGSVDVNVLRHVNTFLQYITRLTLKDRSDLEEVAIRDYLQFEEVMGDWVYESSLVEKLRWAVNELFGDWTIEASDFHPKFSNGATANVARGRGMAKKMVSPLTWGAYQILNHVECNSFVHVASFPSDQASKYQSVPKSIDKRRSINMEPTYNQYVQQGIFLSFDQYCRKHPQTRINLHAQGRNRAYALIGSRDRSFSTIDLSNASDSVSLKLIKQICRDLQPYPFLIRSRTSYVDVAGQVIRTRKYAAMGNATCFPIECLVFSAIVYLAQSVTGIYGKYTVYGDDIVVSSELAPVVVDILERLHFSVNREKTFVDSWFTESCGIECYHGCDITPIRIGRRYDAYKAHTGFKSDSSSVFLGCMDHINQFYGTCYHLTRRYLIRALLEDFPLTFFCKPTEEYGIKSDNPTNGHLTIRSGFSERDTRVDGRRSTAYRYQRCEWYTYVPYSRTEYGPDDLRYQAALWHLENHPRDYLDEFNVHQSKIGRTTTRLRRVWYPGWLTPSQIQCIRQIRGYH